jgi:hypothetical protein
MATVSASGSSGGTSTIASLSSVMNEQERMGLADEKQTVAKLAVQYTGGTRKQQTFLPCSCALSRLDPLTQLPPEIWSLIFEYLPLHDLFCISSICLTFQSITNDNNNDLWRRVHTLHFGGPKLNMELTWKQECVRLCKLMLAFFPHQRRRRRLRTSSSSPSSSSPSAFSSFIQQLQTAGISQVTAFSFREKKDQISQDLARCSSSQPEKLPTSAAEAIEPEAGAILIPPVCSCGRSSTTTKSNDHDIVSTTNSTTASLSLSETSLISSLDNLSTGLPSSSSSSLQLIPTVLGATSSSGPQQASQPLQVPTSEQDWSYNMLPSQIISDYENWSYNMLPSQIMEGAEDWSYNMLPATVTGESEDWSYNMLPSYLHFYSKPEERGYERVIDRNFPKLLWAVENNYCAVVERVLRECGEECPIAAHKWKPSFSASDRPAWLSEELWENVVQYGDSLLTVAARRGNIKIVQALLKNKWVKVDDRACDDETAFYWASRFGHVEVMQLLYAHKADINAETKSGSTPLLRAIREGQLDAVKWLLAHGANVKTRSKMTAYDEEHQLYTVLHMAARYGREEIARLILEHPDGAHWINTTDAKMKTPLVLAREGKFKDLINLLKAHGAV